jgi:hypothetical protein
MCKACLAEKVGFSPHSRPGQELSPSSLVTGWCADIGSSLGNRKADLASTFIELGPRLQGLQQADIFLSFSLFFFFRGTGV